MGHDHLVAAHDCGDCSALGQVDFLDFPADRSGKSCDPCTTASSASATPRRKLCTG